MAFAYPSDINATVGIMGTLNYVNSVTGGWVANMILISLYCIALFSLFKANEGDFAGAMAMSGFFVFVVSLVFWLAGFVNAITFSIVIAMAIIGVVVLLVNKQ